MSTCIKITSLYHGNVLPSLVRQYCVPVYIGDANYSASTNNVFYVFRGGFRVATASKIECFVIIVNGFHPLTIIIKHSILDVAATLDPPLVLIFVFQFAVLGKELLTRIKLISVN